MYLLYLLYYCTTVLYINPHQSHPIHPISPSSHVFVFSPNINHLSETEMKRPDGGGARGVAASLTSGLVGTALIVLRVQYARTSSSHGGEGGKGVVVPLFLKG